MPLEQLPPEQNSAQPGPKSGLDAERAMAALSFSTKLIDDNMLQPPEGMAMQGSMQEGGEEPQQGGEGVGNIEKIVKSAVKEEVARLREEIITLINDDEEGEVKKNS